MSGSELSWGVEGLPWVGLGILALVFGFIWFFQWRHGRRRALAERGPLGRRLVATPLGRDLLRASLVTISALLLVVALKKPRWGSTEDEVRALGIDVVFVLDASKSMKLADVVPDRLDAARLEIHRALDQLHGGRAALVPFAGIAFVQTPLTSDGAVVRNYLDALRVEDMPRGGTAIGRAIETALGALFPDIAKPGEAPPDAFEEEIKPVESAKHKAIVLFTDGEDHEGDAVEAAKKAAKRGVKIFAVGVGTPQGRPVVQLDAEGQVTGTVKGPDGAPLFSALNVKLLKEIATATKGDYFLLGPEGLGPALNRALGALELAEYEDTFQNLGAERCAIALLPAIALLALELWIGQRGRTRRAGGTA